jgi:amino acid permease
MVDFANKAVDFSQYVTYWTGPTNQTHNKIIEISFYFIIPILVNILNVRKYGEVEFWLTAIKVEVILTIIIVGFVIAAGGGPSQLLGTDDAFQVVACNATLLTRGNCTSGPGFNRSDLLTDLY